MKKSQIDTETDKNPQKFPNSKILCSFSPKLSSDFVDWNTEKNQQERMCCPVGFSEDFIAVFLMKMSRIKTKNAKKPKVFSFSKCLCIFC